MLLEKLFANHKKPALKVACVWFSLSLLVFLLNHLYLLGVCILEKQISYEFFEPHYYLMVSLAVSAAMIKNRLETNGLMKFSKAVGKRAKLLLRALFGYSILVTIALILNLITGKVELKQPEGVFYGLIISSWSSYFFLYSLLYFLVGAKKTPDGPLKLNLE